MNKKRQAVIENSEISEMRTYDLGGFEQKVVLDGMKKENPICIFLHGGPGSPFPFGECARGLYPDITEHLTFVYWDQLGCGINNHPIDDSFTVKNYCDMTVDLVRSIKKDFPNNKIILFGVSWGSVLTAAAAYEVPEILDSVFVYGQILKNLTFNDETFATLESSKMGEKQRKILAEIKKSDTHSPKDIRKVTEYIRKYTEGYMAKDGGKLPLGTMVRGMFQSPDYKFKDCMAATVTAGALKNKSLMMELMSTDLSNYLKDVKVPYYIMQGTKDIVTSTQFISKFVEESGNDNLHIKVVDKSAHCPGGDTMPLIIEKLLSLAEG